MKRKDVIQSLIATKQNEIPFDVIKRDLEDEKRSSIIKSKARYMSRYTEPRNSFCLQMSVAKIRISLIKTILLVNIMAILRIFNELSVLLPVKNNKCISPPNKLAQQNLIKVLERDGFHKRENEYGVTEYEVMQFCLDDVANNYKKVIKMGPPVDVELPF